MAETYDVLITVKDQKGHCGHGHKPGDTFLVKGGKTPAGICLQAFAALLPTVRVLMMGGTHPWEEDPDATTIVCQDAANPVLFEVRRLHNQ